MKKNWIKYLGFLGFLGLLGLFTSNPGFFGFFGFYGFLGFAKVKNDERLEANVNKAARNAFLISILSFALATVLAYLIPVTTIYALAFAISFGVQILVFALSLQYYDRTGD